MILQYFSHELSSDIAQKSKYSWFYFFTYKVAAAPVHALH